MALPPHAHVDGLPGNESLQHFILKWAAYRVLTHELECPFALVEADVRAGAARRAHLPRHDALGVRYRTGRPPSPWQEVPDERVRLEVLDPGTGTWRDVPPGPAAFADPTLRAFERLTGDPGADEQPLRAVAPGRRAGTLQVRRSGGQRRELVQLCGADAKQSRGDLQAWLREADRRLGGVHLFLIVAPLGLATADELPPKVGLAEVDLDRLLNAEGQPAIRVTRWPEALRPATAWSPERTLTFQRHAYYAMHGLFARQLFWFLAQRAVERQRAAALRHAGGGSGGAGGAPVRGVDGDPGAGRATSAGAGPAGADGLAEDTDARGDGAGAASSAASAGPWGPGIRAYRHTDREAVVALWARTGFARPGLNLGAELDRHPDPGLILVAEAPGAGVVGAVMGTWDGRRGWIYHLAVDAAHRRRGLGRALLAAAEARLADRGAPKVQVMVREDNASVIPFYERCGYAREPVTVWSKWLR